MDRKFCQPYSLVSFLLVSFGRRASADKKGSPCQVLVSFLIDPCLPSPYIPVKIANSREVGGGGEAVCEPLRKIMIIYRTLGCSILMVLISSYQSFYVST